MSHTEKRIIITSPEGIRRFNEMVERKKANEERIKSRMPPADVIKRVREITDKVYEANKGNLDKNSFHLGMISMWYEMQKLSISSTSPAPSNQP